MKLYQANVLIPIMKSVEPIMKSIFEIITIFYLFFSVLPSESQSSFGQEFVPDKNVPRRRI